MNSIINANVSDNWDDEVELELSIIADPPPSPPPLSTSSSSSPVTVAELIQADVKMVQKYRGMYDKYPYFMAGAEGTVMKGMFPRAEFPLAEFKKALESNGLLTYVNTLRNYIKSLFYVIKSTKYFNPVAKTRVAPKSKHERIDITLVQNVTIEDQIKAFKLFGFQGHVGGAKKDDEDSKREELLETLKSILYNTQTLSIFVHLMLERMSISFSYHDIQGACQQLKTWATDYDCKSYNLPSSWYHDSKWAKLRYVYGASRFDNMTVTDGQLNSDIMCSMLKAQSYKK